MVYLNVLLPTYTILFRQIPHNFQIATFITLFSLSLLQWMEKRDLFETIRPIGLDEEPEKPVFSASYIDHSVDPLDDFFMYSCGKWVQSHPIPEDKFLWGASMELIERNVFVLGKILERCAEKSFEPENSIEKQLGDYYISAMDKENIEKLRFKPISGMLAKVNGMKEKGEIPDLIAYLHQSGIEAFFRFGVEPDLKNSGFNAVYINQGGLALPNRDYYLEENFKELRADYLKHVENLFRLQGVDETQAESYAKIIMAMETGMAKASRKPVELRDPEKNYNKIELGNAEESFGNLKVRRYLQDLRMDALDYIIVGQSEFIASVSDLLNQYSLDEWKVYLRWKIIHFASPFLHEEAEKENFDFFQKKLLGQNQMESRWKRVVMIIDGTMGEALGKMYVEQEFGSESEKRMKDMIEDLKEVFTERLENFSWMGEETKNKAIEKFSRFRAKIGYPSKYIDYSPIKISRDDFFGNVLRSRQFEFGRKASMAGKEVDRELWYMTPPTVNAYFSPTDNEIVFPAGILQPPFFDPDLDDAVNYGATGGTIAHEISHGFDDEGRKFDLNGNLKEWWTEEDNQAFMKKAKDVVELYSSLTVLPGLNVNGELTLGENIADLGGVSIAFEALQRRLKKFPEKRKPIDGLTPEQRFFLGWAQSWRESVREMALKYQISNDVHSPARIRAEIPARVHEGFEETFSNLTKKNEQQFKKIKIW